jgi:indole-3-acetate monooxygenase
MTCQTVGDLLGAIERIAPLISEHAASAEADRHLSDAVYHAMYDAGLYGMLAPKAYGGIELHPTNCLRLWEAVARIDAAAAWNLVMNQAIAAYSAWLPPKGVAELFASGIPTIAGALHPPAKAVRVDGGWRITGQVPFASGCHHTQWLVMPAQEEGADTPFGIFFPRQSATIVNAGVKMYRRAGVKLHHGWTPNAPTARLCCTTNRMRSDCLTGECFRDFEPA